MFEMILTIEDRFKSLAGLIFISEAACLGQSSFTASASSGQSHIQGKGDGQGLYVAQARSEFTLQHASEPLH